MPFSSMGTIISLAGPLAQSQLEAPYRRRRSSPPASFPRAQASTVHQLRRRATLASASCRKAGAGHQLSPQSAISTLQNLRADLPCPCARTREHLRAPTAFLFIRADDFSNRRVGAPALARQYRHGAAASAARDR